MQGYSLKLDCLRQFCSITKIWQITQTTYKNSLDRASRKKGLIPAQTYNNYGTVSYSHSMQLLCLLLP